MATIQTYNKLFKTLEERGPEKNILLLYGEEDYLKKVTVERLEKFLNTKRVTFFGQDASQDDISRELMNTGLFQSQKLVVVYEFERLKNWNNLFSLKPPKNSYLICIISSSSDKRKLRNILQNAKKHKGVQILEFKPLDVMGFRAWVKNRFKKHNIHIDETYLSLLVKHLPSNLLQAEKELEKLFLYIEEDYPNIEHLKVLSGTKERSLSTILLENMGYEKKNLASILNVIEPMRTNEILYELETHMARIQDVHLGTYFSDRYRNKWRLSPYKKSRMLHTLKDAAIMEHRLLNIEYTSKTSLHNEKITKVLIVLSLLP